jgi:amino acid transporter
MADYNVHEKDRDYGGYPKKKQEEDHIRSHDSSSINSAHGEATYDSTHRQLRPRHIQLIGIGGTIGTALYVQIGHGLLNGGPASLFMAFTIWCTFILAVTNVSDPIQAKVTSELVRLRAGQIPSACLR